MNQVPSLLDTFANNRKDALSKAGVSADSKSHQQNAGASRDLLPIDPAGKGNGGASAPSSFQAKVKASSAKLAAKAHKFFPQNKVSDAKPENLGPKEKAVDRPETNRANADRQNDSAKGVHAGNHKSEAARKPAVKSESSRTAPVRQNDGQGKAEAAPRDEAAYAKLKEGLESLGIHATDEQLNDPAFLRDILQMLQIMPPITDAPIATGEMPDVAVEGSIESVEAATVVVPSLGQPAPETGAGTAEDDADPDAAMGPEKTALPQAKSGADKEITALIQNRMSELAQNPKTALEGSVAAAAPTTTPSQWQGIVVRPQTESITTEPLPMADLDRLRVLQASALQAGTAGKESTSITEAGPDESADAAPDTEISAAWAAEDGSESAGERDSADREADHFGRNGDPSRNAEVSARKDGPLAAREGATGIQFNANTEQARSVDNRASIERAWEPRQPAFESGVLDQIAKKMSAIGQKNGDNISIQLSPDHLGKVRVSLEMKDGAMSARISVENDGVRQQVEAGIAALRDTLENQGIKLQGLEVSVEQRHDSLFNPDGRNAESFFHRNGRGGKDGEATPETAPFESAPESDTGRRLGYNTMEFIG